MGLTQGKQAKITIIIIIVHFTLTCYKLFHINFCFPVKSSAWIFFFNERDVGYAYDFLIQPSLSWIL